MRRIVHGARHVSPEALEAARRSRRSPTEAEALAWEILRARRCLGLKFRRQQVIGAFRVDFYCPALALVIEIDGGVHDDPAEALRDAMRAQALVAEGLRVVRVRNEEVSRESFERVLGGLCRGGDGGDCMGAGASSGAAVSAPVRRVARAMDPVKGGCA